jgi:hypothetical protein
MARYVFADRLIVRAESVNATFYWKIPTPKPPSAPRNSLIFLPRRAVLTFADRMRACRIPGQKQNESRLSVEVLGLIESN